MDFKMNFNPINVRESTIDHYGKRGISWHGFYLIYYMYDENTKDATKYCAYLVQILSNGNEQDIYCVLSLLKAGLKQIHNDLPFVKSTVLYNQLMRDVMRTIILLLESVYSINCTILIRMYQNSYTRKHRMGKHY